MQVVPELVCTQTAAMAILHTELGTLGPHLLGVPGTRFHDVQDDSHPVFVLVAHNAFICVRSLTNDDFLVLVGVEFERAQGFLAK